MHRPPEDVFAADILDTPGLNSTMSKSDMVNLGEMICTAIPEGASHADLVAKLGVSKLGPQVMEVFVSAAERDLCPVFKYGRQSAAVAPPVAAGPIGLLPPGVYEVGTGAGQVAPGKYRSSGPDGSNAAGCYYARLRHNDGSFGDILGSNITEGQSLMTVKTSDGYVEIAGCTFAKA